jgi:hypothetical protein
MPARNQKAKQPLKLAEVYALAMWWRETGTLKGTARNCGVDLDTARRYVNNGDPARGIPPLRLVQPSDLPPLPVAWKQKGGAIPGTDGIPDAAALGEEPVEVAPAAVVLTAPSPSPAPRRPGAAEAKEHLRATYAEVARRNSADLVAEAERYCALPLERRMRRDDKGDWDAVPPIGFRYADAVEMRLGPEAAKAFQEAHDAAIARTTTERAQRSFSPISFPGDP